MATPYAYLPQRAVLSLTGPDTLALLERLVTHNTSGWSSGETRYGALLTPQGKVIADYLGLRTNEGVLLDVAREALEDLARRLALFRLRADVEIAPRPDLFVLAGLEPGPEGPRPVSGAAHVLLDTRYPGGRLRALANEAQWSSWHGGHPAEWSRPLPDYHEDRIRHAVAEWGTDFTAAEVFPSDINMDRMGGVDLKKGCFVGQEVVSRMHRRGNVRRRSVALEAEAGSESESLAPGLALEAKTPVGEITSVEGRRAIARVRIDRLARAGDDGVTVGGRPVHLTLPDWLREEMASGSPDV